MKIKGNLQPLLLCSVVLLWSNYASADIECRFNNGNGGTVTAVPASYSGQPLRLPTPKYEDYIITRFTTGTSPGVSAGCSLGGDGEDMWSKADPSVLVYKRYRDAMFQTNIPGIYYAVRIETSGNHSSSAGGYFSAETGSFQIVAENDGAENNWDGKWFVAHIELTMTAHFKGNPNKVSVLRPIAGTWGQMSLGNPSDSNNQPITFKVTSDTFAIPLVMPTCDVLASDKSGNNVDMGEYFISDINKGNVRDVPFTISAGNCSSVSKFTTKLTSTKVTGSSNDLLGNTLTSNAASGLGVKILYNTDQQLIPNSANSTYVVADETVPERREFKFIARMEPNGEPLKAGQFKATSVFTLTYD